MKCPHCQIAIHGNWSSHRVTRGNVLTNFVVKNMQCPDCKQEIIKLANRNTGKDYHLIYPRFPSRNSVPSEVPKEIAEDYKEACDVLNISAKASAALSRRCLQSILSAHGYTGKNLAKQVDAVLSERDASKALSPALITTIDAIRNFGNFSAHPINDITSQQVIPVEPHEAEFCLEIVEEMFDHFYVRPALAAKRKAALDAKLAAGGKPPSK